MIKLLKDAGATNKDLFKCVEDAESNCDVCKCYRKPKIRPAVGLLMACDLKMLSAWT